MSKHNGWTNYATWRVNLEIFDGMTLEDLGFDFKADIFDIESALQEYAESIIEMTSQAGLARDYALAFLSDVNWLEIANRLIEDCEERQAA